MIDKELLEKTVAEAIAGTDLFIVDINIGAANAVNVEIDSATGVDIDACARITRHIESVFDREAEDYELEVGSAGITSPLKVRAQFEKNLGNTMEVLTRDGKKLYGVLAAVAPGNPLDTDVEFTLEVSVKVKEPGMKRPVVKTEELPLRSTDCKYVRYDLKF